MDQGSWDINLNKLDKPYDSQWDLMTDFMVILDIRLYYLYKYHMWVGPENNLQNMMGLAVSRAEFEMNLVKAADYIASGNLAEDEIKELNTLGTYFDKRLIITMNQGVEAEKRIPLLKLIRLFSLDSFAANCFLLSFVVQTEKKYEKIFAFLQDDILKKLPVAETAIRLFASPGEMHIEYLSYFSGINPLVDFILYNKSDDKPDGLLNHKLRIRGRILDYLVGNKERFETGYFELFSENDELLPLILGGYTEKRLDSLLQPAIAENDEEVKEKEHVLAFISGRKGSGRKFQVKHAIRRKGGRCLFVNIKTVLEAQGEMDEKLQEVFCESMLSEAHICFTDFDALLEDANQKELYNFITSLSRNARYLTEVIFITSEKQWKDTSLPHNFIKADIEIESVDENARLAFWESYTIDKKLSQEINLGELASKFRFTPGQIFSSVNQAAGLCEVYGKPAIDVVTLHKCCYAQVVMRLDALATQVKPAYDWEDIVLPSEQVLLLKEACSHVKYRHTVYQTWGFDKRVSYGKGLAMLFSGPPGTGKTMAAQVVANQLHMEMYKIQLSQVVSKYIGETEKNLRQIFEEAKNSNCILFFDETDAIFGKRSEVKDSHDRHANIETAYLLQQMEEYEGVIIMATNLLQNIDSAFMRRINFVINFPFPDVQTRRMLWEKMLSTGAPLSEDVNLDFLASQFKLAGGNIKNIVVHAAFQAAAEMSSISMKHLVQSTVKEQRKNNIIVVKEELKEYADYVF